MLKRGKHFCSLSINISETFLQVGYFFGGGIVCRHVSSRLLPQRLCTERSCASNWTVGIDHLAIAHVSLLDPSAANQRCF